MCYIYTVKMNDYMGQWMLNVNICYFCQIHLKWDMKNMQFVNATFILFMMSLFWK